MTICDLQQDMIPGEVKDFVGVWRVTQILDGSITVSDTWARKEQRIALFENMGQVCMFGDSEFSFNSYEQFHFQFDPVKKGPEGFLLSRNAAPGVHVKVGFVDEKLDMIFFRFYGSQGADCHGGGGGWGGDGGND